MSNLREEGLTLALWFLRVQSMVACLHVVGQNIVVVQTCGKGKLFTSWQRGGKQRERE
jgi:hypothetical protein